ncbi:type III pantothenate kinase [Aquimarina sp. U1-2]|uniref:type III pantothenate kinase n=1 Tax=Aquimarina sp. U1-2 TaxID=2823141 RepID=UPI001AECC602|nr:type III pantothenate kinase [Aquimarina sp. U1-2]MBP2831696.1 type III pantothenate kinase [Aquimarina sp. U1-2]
MNLVIDVGNSYVKIGIFEQAQLVQKKVIVQADFKKTIDEVKKDHPAIRYAIVASVANLPDGHITYLTSFFDTLILDHSVAIPFTNLYATPKTLGIDRIALVAAAVAQFPKQNTLIIDAGTCITYDFKNKKEEYLGGSISPGIKLRYTSLHTYTAKLPLLSLKEPLHVIGSNTEEAIHAGVVQGVSLEIAGLINEYCNIYPDLTVILTGGDAHFLSKRLKNSIFATSNFLLEGLNYILAFNTSR